MASKVLNDANGPERSQHVPPTADPIGQVVQNYRAVAENVRFADEDDRVASDRKLLSPADGADTRLRELQPRLADMAERGAASVEKMLRGGQWSDLSSMEDKRALAGSVLANSIASKSLAELIDKPLPTYDFGEDASGRLVVQRSMYTPELDSDQRKILFSQHEVNGLGKMFPAGSQASPLSIPSHDAKVAEAERRLGTFEVSSEGSSGFGLT